MFWISTLRKNLSVNAFAFSLGDLVIPRRLTDRLRSENTRTVIM